MYGVSRLVADGVGIEGSAAAEVAALGLDQRRSGDLYSEPLWLATARLHRSHQSATRKSHHLSLLGSQGSHTAFESELASRLLSAFERVTSTPTMSWPSTSAGV